MSQGFVAAGNISPGTIVKESTTGSGKVVQCTGTSDVSIGICQLGTHNAPLSGFDDGFAAVSGLDITVFTVGDRASVRTGGAVTTGDLLTSDGSGRAVTGAGGNRVVGQALENATAADQFILCLIMPGKM